MLGLEETLEEVPTHRGRRIGRVARNCTGGPSIIVLLVRTFPRRSKRESLYQESETLIGRTQDVDITHAKHPLQMQGQRRCSEVSGAH